MSKKAVFIESWLSKAIVNKFSNGAVAKLYFNAGETMDAPKDVQKGMPAWQKEKFATGGALFSFESEAGPVWIVSPFLKSDKKTKLESDPWLESSRFAKIRDAAGSALAAIMKSGAKQVEIFGPPEGADIRAFAVGLEISQYRYKNPKESKPLTLKWDVDSKILKEAETAGYAVNVARHMVNLPPNELFPLSFVSIAESLLAKCSHVDVEVWKGEKLKKERMNLLVAVGQAAHDEPCLLKLSYRGSKKAKPIALVGKGVTFDSGGLDIKPSSGMRLMKKDMGGAAAVFGAFLWAASTKAPVSIDAYLPLAENAVGSKSFRPGDVYVSRNGQSVEIHNTDAEGRLVLVDAIDVALTAKEKPETLINVATLTGAIKVTLGSAMPGIFSNHVPFRERLRKSFWDGGDPVWPMPLIQKYRSQMLSNFADMTNAVDGFGGAVTAALFLESFVGDTPWAHFDIYGWKDSADGAWSESGGSGQAVLGLIEYLRTLN
jgi:leucyl aminopeptidase